MNEQPKPRFLSKQKLEIIEIKMDESYSQGAKQLDRIQAVNLSLAETDSLYRKEIKFTVFEDILKKFIRGKKAILADIKEKDRPETNYPPDRTIVQVYDDQGNPVLKKGAGGFGGGNRRSLEDDLALEAFKRVSIEGQTMVAQVGALLVKRIGGVEEFDQIGLKGEDWNRILAKYWKAVEKGLDNYLAAPKTDPLAKTFRDNPNLGGSRPNNPPVVKPTPETSGNAPGKPQVKQDAPPTAFPDERDAPAEKPQGNPIKNAGDLLTRASKLDPPVMRAEILKGFQISSPTEIGDLEGAWKKIQDVSAAGKRRIRGRTLGKHGPR
ncbi:MAG: hypothetical protein WC329_01740 [Candidatus Omnitrophota bacterium]|jgi:hypothetical protein